MMTSGGRVRLGTMLTLALLLAATVGLAPRMGLAQAAGCWAEAPTLAGGYPQWTTPPQQVIDPDGSYTATVETNRGPIVIELLPAQAPTAVNNFVCLALAGYYDVTVFHRIIEGFMIQGGDPTGTGTGGPGYQFADEVPTGEAPYTRGTVAMANAGPNTNGSQFFIVHQDQPAEFPANYSIFGRVVEGMETVDAIAAAPVTGSAARPEEQSSPLATLGIKEITITDGTGQPLAAEVASQAAASPVAGTAATAEATTAAEPTVAPAATVEDDDDGSNLGLWIAIGAALLAGIGYFLWSQRRRAPAAPAARSRTQVRRTEPVTAEPEVAADPPAGTRPAPRTQSRPKPQRRQRKK